MLISKRKETVMKLNAEHEWLGHRALMKACNGRSGSWIACVLLTACSGCLAFVSCSRAGGRAPTVDALEDAVMSGDINGVTVLIKKGVDVNAKTRDGIPCLSIAANQGNAEIVNELLSGGAKIDAVSNNGYTALHQALMGRHENVAKILIASGSNVAIRSREGLTPYDIAKAEHLSNDLLKQLSGNEGP
jgi:hypothetical protein